MDFDIIKYLDSLQEDIKMIHLSERGLTYIPDKLTRFTNLKFLYCANNKLTYLPPLPKSLQVLYCGSNQLTSLPPLPENLVYLNCNYNRLNNLHSIHTLPKELEELHCINNRLTYLPRMNKKLKKLNCDNNRLTSLPLLNEKLTYLNCCYNQLTSLPVLNEKLEVLYCSNNELTSLPLLNENLYLCHYKYNPIYEIMDYCIMYNIDNIDMLKIRIQILNRFRYTYYSLKFKSRFRKWLWERIRRPKIERHFHPDYLLEHLHEDTDLDTVLENW